MKILFFTDTLREGGKERQLVQLLKGLANEKDVTCEIVLMKNDIHFKEVLEWGMPIHVLKPGTLSNLYTLCRRSRPDIIHTWNLKTSLLSILPAKFTGTKLLNGSVRNAKPNRRGFGKFRMLSRLSYIFSDAIAANSITGLKNQGYTRPKGVCIHNGFDMSRVARLEGAAAVRRRFGLKTMYVVGMVGSFVDAKDYKTFIAAADKVTAQRNDVTFVAVGDGPELQRHKKTLNIALEDKFKFLGKQDDVESIVNLFNVGVLACNTNGHAEGMPNSIMEYMALEKPVVATDSGGNRELLIHDETGFIVKPFDAAELTARLLYLLDHPDRANQMGIRGKKRIEEKFSLERMVKGYVSLYRGMCGVSK